jgi:hypothetical protein
VSLSIKLLTVAAMLAAGVAVAVAVAPAPAPAKQACPLPTKPPETSTGPTGTGPTGAGPGAGGPPPPGATVMTSTNAAGPPTGPPTGPTTPTTSTGQAPGEGGGDCPPGPKASAADRAATYGKYCRKLSRKADRGRESPYSQCTAAMARVTLGTMGLGAKTTPARACKAESRRRPAGHGPSPYALCVTAGKKLAAQLKNAMPKQQPQ